MQKLELCTQLDTAPAALKYALRLGARLSWQQFVGSWYRNQRGERERAADLLGPGLGAELNAGVLLSGWFALSLLYEHHQPLSLGVRLAGQEVSAHARLWGASARVLLGDTRRAAFFFETSLGARSVRVRSAAWQYTLSAFEFLRMTLGVEWRLAGWLVLSPQLGVAAGSMQHARGDMRYAPGQADRVQAPRFYDDAPIDDPSSYFVLSFGLGVHFDWPRLR